ANTGRFKLHKTNNCPNKNSELSKKYNGERFTNPPNNPNKTASVHLLLCGINQPWGTLLTLYMLKLM
ncbi:hypothetical protein CWB71_19615, partial [Pseudoalteromonas sp. S983]